MRQGSGSSRGKRKLIVIKIHYIKVYFQRIKIILFGKKFGQGYS